MIKIANIKSHWPKIYNKLKTFPGGLGGFSSKLPNLEKIILDDSQKDPTAYGYVSTEDVDGDGKLDVIHINSPKLSQELAKLGFDEGRLANIDVLSEEELKSLLSVFVELISHEMGHLKDFHQHGEFKGGETPAELEANNALRNIATNKEKVLTKKGSFMKKEIVSELAKLASALDESGAAEAANFVDLILQKSAQWVSPGRDIGPDSEQFRLPQTGSGRMPLQVPGQIPGEIPVRTSPQATSPRSDLRDNVQVDVSNPFDIKPTSPVAPPQSGGRRGSIQLPGDPFTYDYVAEGDYFIVRSAPPESISSVGYKMKSGSRGYEKLKKYIPRLQRPAIEDSNQVASGKIPANPAAGGMSGLDTLPEEKMRLLSGIKKILAGFLSGGEENEYLKTIVAPSLNGTRRLEMLESMLYGRGGTRGLVNQSNSPFLAEGTMDMQTAGRIMTMAQRISDIDRQVTSVSEYVSAAEESGGLEKTASVDVDYSNMFSLGRKNPFGR